MPRSPMDECDYLFVQVEYPYLGIILNTKGDFVQFLWKLCDKGLLGDLSPMRRSQPGMGRDMDHPEGQSKN